MALIRIPEEDRRIERAEDIAAFLAPHGVDYERIVPGEPVAPDAPANVLLEAYRETVEALKARGGYVVADVIDVFPDTPGLEAMLNKFNSEHVHDEDEVRLIIEGRGVFHLHFPGTPVIALEVGPGDLIRVPQGTHHWFDLCTERRIRAIRLFKDPSGWVPRYTNSGVDKGFQPICFGPTYFPPVRASYS
jgi:1,2-dihydroxy-3-keto-5-methylthiopentene dioxygenase